MGFITMNRLEVARLLRKESGFVLLITLLIVLLFVVIIFEIDFQARADRRAAGNFRDDLAAYYVALSGITAEKAILEDDQKNAGSTDYLNELWAGTSPPFPIGDGTASGHITDERGKFNLNSLLDHPTLTTDKINAFKKAQLERLFELLLVDPHLVDPIIDWIDIGSDSEQYGAEDETYQVLKFPYSTKNGPLDTLEEILYIKGITQDIYQTISPYLTVYIADGKINVNTADPIILQSIDKRIDESTAKSLMENMPYSNVTSFCDALGSAICKLNTTFQNFFDVQSSIFSIVATGTVRNTSKTIHAVWDRAKKQYLYFKVE
ncbi:MAG: type II secretion system minor pseudopilin GspK [Nitrospirae bacterium]|nr:type II secretion system minor pseudopilin GspK [Candidatus Troglogloeales bacterium]